MSRRITFRQSDIERALKPALRLGLEVARYEIDRSGRVSVFIGNGDQQVPFAADDELDRELAKFEANHGQD